VNLNFFAYLMVLVMWRGHSCPRNLTTSRYQVGARQELRNYGLNFARGHPLLIRCRHFAGKGARATQPKPSSRDGCHVDPERTHYL
jgi:hypothetical protein